MRSLRFYITLAGVLFGFPSWAQSGWVRPKGEAYLQAGYHYFQSNTYFNLSGESITTNYFRQHTVSFYGEYGLTDRWDVILSMPLYRANSFETTTWAQGIGDLRLEAKYALLTGPIPVSISVAPEIPTGPKNNFATNKEFVWDQINLPTGDGEWNVWSTLAASHSFYPVPVYVSAYGSYNFRTGFNGVDFRDQVRYGLEVGYQPCSSWWIILKGGAHITPDDEAQGVTDFTRGDGTNFMTGTLQIGYKVAPSWWLQAQVQQYFDGWHPRTNLYSAPLVGVSVAWELKP